MRILSIGLVGWPRTDVWSAASGGAETESQFRDGRRRAPFSPPSATIPGERARFRPLAPSVAVWAALCGGVAGVWPRRRDRAPWAGGGRGGERVLPARGCASCPSVSPDGPTGPPLRRGGASHEAEGRRGARRGGAGRVGPPATRRRLCVLCQRGDQLVAGPEQFLFVDDVVAVEDGAALVAGQAHGDPLGHAGPAPPARRQHPLARPPATSRAAPARPASCPVTASPRGPLHRSPNKRVLSGRLAPVSHPFPGHTPSDVAFAHRQLTPIRRPGSLETSRQRHGPGAGHVSGPYPRRLASHAVGCATPGPRPYAVVRRTRRRGGAVRGAAVRVVWGRPPRGVACACCAR